MNISHYFIQDCPQIWLYSLNYLCFGMKRNQGLLLVLCTILRALAYVCDWTMGVRPKLLEILHHMKDWIGVTWTMIQYKNLCMKIDWLISQLNSFIYNMLSHLIFPDVDRCVSSEFHAVKSSVSKLFLWWHFDYIFTKH